MPQPTDNPPVRGRHAVRMTSVTRVAGGRAPPILKRVTSRPDVSVTPTRAKVEHASSDVVQRLSGMPVAATLGAFVVVLVLGAVLGGLLGGLLLLVDTVVVAWLAYLAWPRLGPAERMMRAAVIFLLAAVTVVAAVSHRLLF